MRRRKEDELDEEIRGHLERAVRDRIEDGTKLRFLIEATRQQTIKPIRNPG